jgi:hypothetical protein
VNIARRSLGILAALAIALPLAACSDDLSRSSDTTQAGSELPAPVIVDVNEIDGTTVSVPLGNVVVVNADDPTAWTATVADASVATFTPGSDDGSATFNPGFAPVQAGTTEVTMTDGTTTVTFTLEVTA